ncbi:MAG: hypothetical protein ACRD8W_25935 [Nitrososphaeraceae archaeon]
MQKVIVVLGFYKGVSLLDTPIVNVIIAIADKWLNNISTWHNKSITRSNLVARLDLVVDRGGVLC